MFTVSNESNRIGVVDALRGFALLGIILANLPYAGVNVPEGTLDSTWSLLHGTLIQSKFITIFSILFGFGFWMQFTRASESGVRFTRYFLIRMGLLFLIGCAHAYLLWMGDIIRAYALGGALLLLFRNWSVKRLLLLAVFFNVVLTGLTYIAIDAIGLQQQYDFDPALWEEHMMADSYGRYLWVNYIIDNWRHFLQDMPLTLFFTFGNMLLGMALGKSGFFTGGCQKLLRSRWNIPVLVGLLGLNYVFHLVISGQLGLSLPLIWMPFVLSAGIVALAVWYMGWFIRVYSESKLGAVLSVFQPVGRTALTNYILQSVVYLAVFYHAWGGLNLYGRLTFGETWFAGVLIFGLQLLVSHYWLRFFKQGPLEWLWKKASYAFVIKRGAASKRIEKVTT